MIAINRLDELNSRTTYHFKDTITRHTQGEVIAELRRTVLVPPGRYEETIEEKALCPAAIVSLTSEDYRFDLGGTFNHDTRKLYCYQLLEKGDKILNTMNNGTVREYTILAHDDKSDYDEELHIYYLERSDLE